MAYKIQYFEEVKTDVKEAKDWYKKQQDQLQIRFASAIKEAIIQIQKTPDAFAIRYKNVRVVTPRYFLITSIFT